VVPETLLQSSRYAEFVRGRDVALERIHVNAQVDLARITYAMLAQIENLTASAAIKVRGFGAHAIAEQYESGTKEIMRQVFPVLVRRAFRLRRAAFVLSYAGEQEAIGRATKRRAAVSRSDFANRIETEMAAPTLYGDPQKRIWLALMNLRRRIVQAFETALTQELEPHDVVERVKMAFPKVKVYRRPPLTLVKPIREAEGDPREPKDWLDLDFIDSTDWDLAVQSYKDSELPASRLDNVAGYAEGTGMMKYDWELEQEATEDFVRSVRQGQVKGAEDMGVKEFVWIALIDNKTCDECCLPRNGLTTGEIDDLGDDCGVTVPPAHPHCRCQIGPVAATDEVEGPDWSSFNEWLEAA
jgi:SPP1 gp7 family putative phage head morphogenesis protein